MMDGLHERLGAAVAATRASRARKIFVPGVRRLAVRALARRSRRPRRLHAPLFFGGDIEIVLPEFVSESIYVYGFFDEVVSSLAMLAARPGDIVLDVGGHFGYFSALFSALVGEQGHVYTFEPTPVTFEILDANARRRANVTAIPAAAGDDAGEHEMLAFDLEYLAWNTLAGASRLPAGAVAHGKRVTVPVIRLDDFVRERGIAPNVVKIDAENFEDHVVNGMRETIAACRPRVILEAGSEAALKASRKLLDAGYVPYVYLSFESIVPWQRTIEEANAIGRDILFIAGATGC
jgi:FkbM family methyltransferase